MSRNLKALRTSVSSIVILAGIFALFMGTVMRKGANQQSTRSSTPRIQNKTHSFQVEQARANPGANGCIQLSLRNGYHRRITAYGISANKLITIIDFLYSVGEDQPGIAPDAVHTRPVCVPKANDPNIAAKEGREILVQAVVFDDGTGDGDPEFIADILNSRRGSKIQLARIIDVVKRVLTSGTTIDDTALEALKSEVSSLTTDSQVSLAESDSLRGQKQASLSLLDDLTHSGSTDVRETIIRFREICERLVARL